MERIEDVQKVASALIDLGIRGYTDNLRLLEELNPAKYPSFHADIYKALRKGKYELVDVNDVGEVSIITDKGERYYTMLNITPFERRLMYVFEYDGLKFALAHPLSARSLDERMAVEGITDPETYEKVLKGVDRPAIHIEGYKDEPYELLIPVVYFRNLDSLLEKYGEEMEIGPKAKELNVLKAYTIFITSADYRNLPRTLPSPNFTLSVILGTLHIMLMKDILVVLVFANSWGRVVALHDLLSKFMYPEMRQKVLFYPPKEYVEDEKTASPFVRPEGVPKPITYTEVARFYNTLMDYEVDGKPLGRIKEEHPVLYRNVIRTFAYIEAQLKKLKAIAFPYETIAGRYL